MGFCNSGEGTISAKSGHMAALSSAPVVLCVPSFHVLGVAFFPLAGVGIFVLLGVRFVLRVLVHENLVA